MTSRTSSIDRTPDEEAALWAARLEGSVLTADDRKVLDAWLAENPAHRALLSGYCQFSADLEQQLPVLVAAGAVKMPRPSATQRYRRRHVRGVAGALAAGAAVALVLLGPARSRIQTEDIATPAARRQSLTLVDGTRVELNARTSLRIDIDRTQRRVRLAAGEAFFAVSKDPSRPFFVETPAGSVRVTGTRFDVRTDIPDGLAVTVVEGTVEVRPDDAAGRPAAPVTLTAGQQLSAGPQGAEVRKLTATALDDSLAWRQGEIVFDGVPLGEALARFGRYHGCGITVTPEAARLPVGGRYSLDDLDGFLAQLETGFPVRVARNSNGTVRVSLRAEP